MSAILDDPSKEEEKHSDVDLMKLLKFTVKYKRINLEDVGGSQLSDGESMEIDSRQDSIMTKIIGLALSYDGGSESPEGVASSNCLGKLLFYSLLRLDKGQKPPA